MSFNKYRFKTHLMNMAMWYGLISMVLDMTQLQPMPFILLGIALFMAWME